MQTALLTQPARSHCGRQHAAYQPLSKCSQETVYLSQPAWLARTLEPENFLRGSVTPAQQVEDMLSESDSDSELYEDCDGVRVRVAQLGPDVQRAMISSPTANALGVRGGDAGARRGRVGEDAWARGASGDNSLAHQRRGGENGGPSGRSLARGSRSAVGGMSGVAVSACESEDEMNFWVANQSAAPSPQGARGRCSITGHGKITISLIQFISNVCACLDQPSPAPSPASHILGLFARLFNDCLRPPHGRLLCETRRRAWLHSALQSMRVLSVFCEEWL